VDVRNPLNIGAAARAMSNFGFLRLRVVNPYDVAFEGARSAVGAASVLATAEKYETVAEAVADCSSGWRWGLHSFARILRPVLALCCSDQKNSGSPIKT
jgi:hypothetical protein